MADSLTVYGPGNRAAALASVAGQADYARNARDFFAFARSRTLSPTDVATLRLWLEEKEKRYAPASLVPMLAGVKKALRGAAHELASAKDAAAFSEALRAVKPPRKTSGAIRRTFLLTPEEEAASSARMSARDRALFHFLLGTGARISEALQIRLEQCKEDRAAVACTVLGKGGKTRVLRIPLDLFEEVRAAYEGRTWLFETSRGKPPVRDYAYRRITKGVLEATGKHFSPHCARHSFATRALERTGKIKAVSEYLGHASAAITLDMYTHEELTDEELARI